MCPNRKKLSFFFDGELPDSEAEKIKIHTEICVHCRSILLGYQSIRRSVRFENNLSLEELSDSAQRTESSIHSFLPFRTNNTKKSLLRALPFVAGVFCSSMLSLFLLFQVPLLSGNTHFKNNKKTVKNTLIQANEQIRLKVRDLNKLPSTTQTQQPHEEIIINLPMEHRFELFGNSVLLHEVDYTRSR